MYVSPKDLGLIDDNSWAIEMADMFPQYVLLRSQLTLELVF
jgi:hypothetical protein